jgi:7,8-dihydropterin-6-yl-methyl-4-(beta-D-ribofuranosyl)aminobenzene 5'-phosphate synthase
MKVKREMLVGLVGLLVAGCGAPLRLPPIAIVVPTHTSAPTVAPTLQQTQEVAPMSIVAPTSTRAVLTAIPTEAAAGTGITITIIYDNNEYDEQLETAWGFSCLVEGPEKTILFDTGGDSTMLLRNMRTLGIDPQDVDVVVISHVHGDHVGGLAGFLEENHAVTVYLPQSFPESIKDATREAGAELIEVDGPVEICERVHSTGELGDLLREQSLAIETTQGLVVVTGCAHPGVVNVVREAKDLLDGDVHLVLGGFHLCWMNPLQVTNIVKGVRNEGVEQVAPCHCSGDLARSTFERVYGDDFILVGVGRRLEIRD